MNDFQRIWTKSKCKDKNYDFILHCHAGRPYRPFKSTKMKKTGFHLKTKREM